jgi:catechol 2,3-dioxygenase-like lactoylglutathione lyase family enzyme
MAVMRLDNVAIVVPDLDETIDFFSALGLSLGGRQVVEGPWVDAVVGLDGVRSEIAMMRTPDGLSQLELTQYLAPAPSGPATSPPPNTLGLTRVMFTVDDIDDTVARLTPLGASVLRDIVDFGDAYRLCYLRGPAGIIVALAQPLSPERR